MWQRPGKQDRGGSATTNYADSGLQRHLGPGVGGAGRGGPDPEARPRGTRPGAALPGRPLNGVEPRARPRRWARRRDPGGYGRSSGVGLAPARAGHRRLPRGRVAAPRGARRLGGTPATSTSSLPRPTPSPRTRPGAPAGRWGCNPRRCASGCTRPVRWRRWSSPAAPPTSRSVSPWRGARHAWFTYGATYSPGGSWQSWQGRGGPREGRDGRGADCQEIRPSSCHATRKVGSGGPAPRRGPGPAARNAKIATFSSRETPPMFTRTARRTSAPTAVSRPRSGTAASGRALRTPPWPGAPRDPCSRGRR